MSNYKVIDRRGERKEPEEASTPSSKPVLPPVDAPEELELEPLCDRVLVFEDREETQSKGGIILPEGDREIMKSGTVIAVGEGARDSRGEIVPLRLKPQDRVLFGKYAGSEIRLNGMSFLVMREGEIFSRVKVKRG